MEDSHLDNTPPIFLIGPIMSIRKEYKECKEFSSSYGRLLVLLVLLELLVLLVLLPHDSEEVVPALTSLHRTKAHTPRFDALTKSQNG